MKTQFDIETPIGFFSTYFELLPQFKNQYETFEFLNDQFEFINGYKMYNNFYEFRTAVSK